MKTTFVALAVLAVGVVMTPVLAQEIEEPTPTPETVIEKACAAAGGWDAYKRDGALRVKVSQEEITQDGKVQKSASTYLLKLPGPIPARFDSPEAGVVAGDDGVKGWAVVQGKPDSRASTAVMVRRLIQSDLFPLLLPFSLKWEGVIISEVRPARLQGQRVWRLTVDFPGTFFSSPQTATRWTIDVHAHTWEVIGAVSPATDMGRGIKADGLYYTWSEPIKVGGLTLRSSERVIGIDEKGAQKAHTRMRAVGFELLSTAKAAALLNNPIPPDQRPKPQIPKSPPILPQGK